MSTISREITVELDSGQSVTLEVEVYGNFEENYGADSDGNRGISTWFIDDIEYELPDFDDNGQELTAEQKVEACVLIDNQISRERWNFDENMDNSDDE